MAKKAIKTEYRVKSPKIDKPIRLALLADIHERKADDIIALLKESEPDIIAVAGDTLERIDRAKRRMNQKHRYNRLYRLFLIVMFNLNRFSIHIFRRNNLPETENACKILSEAAKLAPVFLCRGNHEDYFEEADLAFFSENGITLLNNSDTAVEINGSRLRVGALSVEPDEEWLEGFSRCAGFKLLLCHFPSFYDEYIAGKDIDLTLSGHNHGGQIRLFRRGIISPGGGFFPKYDKGLYEDRLVVTAGCSNTASVPRLNNPRELVVVNIEGE